MPDLGRGAERQRQAFILNRNQRQILIGNILHLFQNQIKCSYS